MQKTYFVKYRVEPNPLNDEFEKIQGAFASMWVLCENEPEAMTLTRNYLAKYHWIIVAVDQHAFVTTLEHYTDYEKELGRKAFLDAQLNGISCCLTAWTQEEDLNY